MLKLYDKILEIHKNNITPYCKYFSHFFILNYLYLFNLAA